MCIRAYIKENRFSIKIVIDPHTLYSPDNIPIPIIVSFSPYAAQYGTNRVECDQKPITFLLVKISIISEKRH